MTGNLVIVPKTACYHALNPLTKKPLIRYGQSCKLLIDPGCKPKPHAPRNVLIQFEDGHKTITNYGCLRFKCKHRSKP